MHECPACGCACLCIGDYTWDDAESEFCTCECEYEEMDELEHDDGLVYLATPYSHERPDVRENRFNVVNRVAADLMRQGIHVYSPISHTHPIAMAGELPKGWDFWERYDRAVLAACVKVIVLRQDGWEESKGVNAEIAIAREMGLPVEFIDP